MHLKRSPSASPVSPGCVRISSNANGQAGSIKMARAAFEAVIYGGHYRCHKCLEYLA